MVPEPVFLATAPTASSSLQPLRTPPKSPMPKATTMQPPAAAAPATPRPSKAKAQAKAKPSSAPTPVAAPSTSAATVVVQPKAKAKVLAWRAPAAVHDVAKAPPSVTNRPPGMPPMMPAPVSQVGVQDRVQQRLSRIRQRFHRDDNEVPEETEPSKAKAKTTVGVPVGLLYARSKTASMKASGVLQSVPPRRRQVVIMTAGYDKHPALRQAFYEGAEIALIRVCERFGAKLCQYVLGGRRNIGENVSTMCRPCVYQPLFCQTSAISAPS